MLTLDNENITPFVDPDQFSIYIEQYAYTHKVSLIMSILQYCEDADVDFEYCVKLMSKSLREKIEQEAIKDKLMADTRENNGLDFLE